METRNVSITLDKAIEWYNSGSADLREIALQAYTEKELTTPRFTNIKNFGNACKALGIPYNGASAIDAVLQIMECRLHANSKASIAMLKLNIIRQALNKGQKMSFTEGTIWYPYTPFVTKESTYYKDELKNGDMVEVAQFTHNGETYRLLGGRAAAGGYAGLGGFDSGCGVGDSDAGVGFLGCATKEIAEHMSKYFAKEIFEAKYGDLVSYEWV